MGQRRGARYDRRPPAESARAKRGMLRFRRLPESTLHPPLPILVQPRLALRGLLVLCRNRSLEPQHAHDRACPPGAEWRLLHPANDEGVAALPARKAAQLATRGQITVFHDFRFTDRLPESGITFRHRVVDDGGRDYKAVHYDHGNGLAVADVDGDGRLDLYFVNQLGGNQLWRNLGGGKFDDITAEAGVALHGPDQRHRLVRRRRQRRRPGPLRHHRAQGQPPVPERRQGPLHGRHRGGGARLRGPLLGRGLLRLRPRRPARPASSPTSAATPPTTTGRGGYYVGLEDAFQGHLHPERSETQHPLPQPRQPPLRGRLGADGARRRRLERRRHGRSTSTTTAGPTSTSSTCRATTTTTRTSGGKRFVDKTAPHFPKTPWGAMGVKVFDYNNDGRLDLYAHRHALRHEPRSSASTRRSARPTCSGTTPFLQGGANNIFGNAFFENLGGGKFEEVSDAMGVENYWPWGLSVGDLNADGFEDVFITASMNFPFRYAINSLLLNDRRQGLPRQRVHPRRRAAPRRPHPHLCSSSTATARTSRKTAVRGPHRQGARHEHARLALLGDLRPRRRRRPRHRHQRLQLRAAGAGQRPRREEATSAGCKVKLRGTQSNRDGLGARVRVKAGGQTCTQWHDGKSGYLSQSLDAALLRPRRRRQGRRHRGHLALGKDADREEPEGGRADRDRGEARRRARSPNCLLDHKGCSDAAAAFYQGTKVLGGCWIEGRLGWTGPYRSGQISGTSRRMMRTTSAVSGVPATTKSRNRYLPGP